MCNELPKVYHTTINSKDVGSTATTFIRSRFTSFIELISGLDDVRFMSSLCIACGWTEAVPKLDT